MENTIGCVRSKNIHILVAWAVISLFNAPRAVLAQPLCDGTTCPALVRFSHPDSACATLSDTGLCIPHAPCNDCRGITVTNLCSNCCITNVRIAEDYNWDSIHGVEVCFSACQDSVYAKGGYCDVSDADFPQSSWCDSGQGQNFTTCVNITGEDPSLRITVEWNCDGVIDSQTFEARDTNSAGPCNVVSIAGGVSSAPCAGFRECGGIPTCDSCYLYEDSLTDTTCCIDSIVIIPDPANPGACFNVCDGTALNPGKGACNTNAETLHIVGGTFCLKGRFNPKLFICRSDLPIPEFFDAIYYCSCGTETLRLFTGH